MAADPAQAGELSSPKPGSDNIFRAALACRTVFQEYLGSPRLYEEPMTRFHQQFQTWAGFLGVFAPVKISLDARLADTPEIEELVLSMVTLLTRISNAPMIGAGLKRHEVPGDISMEDMRKHDDSIMIGIEGAMDRLSRLALIIRSSPKPSKVQSVLNYSRKRDPDGFEDLILALIHWRFGSTESISHQTQFGMSESLQIQLASSIVYRRNRLLYECNREKKFEAVRNGEDVSDTTFTDVPEERRQVAYGEDRKSQQADHSSQRLPEYVVEYTSPNAKQNTLLRKVLTKDMAKTTQDDDTTSYASTTRSTNPFITAEYPEAPELPPGHQSVKCTFCQKPQFKVTVADKTSWRRHVEEDLQPYVWVSEDCGNHPPSFSARRSWEDHMLGHRPDCARHIHRPNKQWTCILCAETGSLFINKEILLQHLKEKHTNDISGARVDIIAGKGRMSVPLHIHTCPFCGESITLESSSSQHSAQPELERGHEGTFVGDATGKAEALANRMSKHIADHLESIAFWSLRWWAEDLGIAQETTKDGEKDSDNLEKALSRDAASQKDPRSLEDRIFDSFQQSEFPNPGEEFLPANMIDILVTRDTVTEVLPDLLDDENGVVLAHYILGAAKQVFTITAIHCGFNTASLHDVMIHFMECGFNDEQLPVKISDLKRHTEDLPPASTSLKRPIWTGAKRDIFLRSQWRYLSPVFLAENFEYDFELNRILPFVWVSKTPREGGFSRVFEAHMHPAHHTGAKIVNKEPISVALKEFFTSPDTYAGEEWEMESNSAGVIRQLRHAHIVDALASISMGPRKFILYQWADGGNLREYWKRDSQPILSPKPVSEVIMQLRGLADALFKLHNEHYRHGDLKPDNILRIKDSSNLGKLMLADLGLAKRYKVATQLRYQTTTRYGTVQYEAPETAVDPYKPSSRRADIWSMGCIMLEFMIWLLYGWEGLQSFKTSLDNDMPGFSHFYVIENINGQKSARTHDAVVSWIERMASDPECSTHEASALGDLLRLIRDRLLVARCTSVLVDPETSDASEPIIRLVRERSDASEPKSTRADASELLSGLTEIAETGLRNRAYWTKCKMRQRAEAVPIKKDSIVTPSRA